MERTGKATPTELARALRMTGYTAPRNITRWLNGDSSPDYDSTLALLAAAGMLNLDAPAPEVGEADANAQLLRELRALDRKIDTVVVPRLDELADERRQRVRGA
jgi:transcriptional regulator with XRE-family HTH domain